MRDDAGADVRCALINGGSFRLGRDLLKGEPVTDLILGDIFYFDNEVVLYELSGEQLTAVLHKSIALRHQGDFLQVAGLLVRGGSPEPALNPADNYRVATTEYVASQCKHYRDIFGTGTLIRSIGPLQPLVAARLTAVADESSFSNKSRWIFT
jgi:2',3'-cyclic-nucleotide 2'-phosphodiesterase (5'-nucleotidase family)